LNKELTGLHQVKSVVCQAIISAAKRTKRQEKIIMRHLAKLSVTLLLFSNVCLAQLDDDLSNLVFEVTLLSQTDNSSLNSPLSSSNNFAPNGEGNSNRDISEDSSAELTASLSSYLASIQQLEQNGDLTNIELAELYDSLGSLYQELDQHVDAIAAFENVIFITRTNNGLESLEQVPFIEKIITSYTELGDLDNINAKEEYLYFLHQRNYVSTDLAMISATFDLIDWNIRHYFKENYHKQEEGLRLSSSNFNRTNRNIEGNESSSLQEFEDPVLPSLNPTASPMMEAIFNGTVKDVFAEDVLDPRLDKAGKLYEELQDEIYKSRNPQLEPILQIAWRIAGLNFIAKQEMDYERDNPLSLNNDYEGSREQAVRNSDDRLTQSYRGGRNALRYVIELAGRALPAETNAKAYLDLGDWHLAYGKVDAAKEAYKEAREILLEAGFTSENIDLSFESPIPTQIPRQATHLYSKNSLGLNENTPLDLLGYIDVSYSIDDQGNADDLVFIDNINADLDKNINEIKRLLRLQLRSMKFRPVLKENELLATNKVNLRYHYSY
jgi:hypothetical protein